MATTNFVDGQTVISADWLNDVDEAVYNPASIILPASSVTITAISGIAATEVQGTLAELAELVSGKQPLDNELTALATSTAAANKIPYFTGTTTAGALDWNAASTLANSATTISSNTVIKAAVDAMDIDTQVAPGTSGNLLTSNGTAWASVADKAIGVSQTWQNVKTTPGRLSNTNYTNDTGRPIMVSVSAYNGTSSLVLTVDSVVVAANEDSLADMLMNVSAVVPAGATYSINSATVTYWAELR